MARRGNQKKTYYIKAVCHKIIAAPKILMCGMHPWVQHVGPFPSLLEGRLGRILPHLGRTTSVVFPSVTTLCKRTDTFYAIGRTINCYSLLMTSLTLFEID
jgi:hypothetical protein